MTEHLRDQLSAFVDGELPRPEVELLLRRLDGNTELQAALTRYVVIGESLRIAPGRSVTRGFAARVKAAVTAEGRSSAVGFDRRVTPRRWLRPLGGVAVAAAVATIAILGLQSLQSTDPVQTPELAASVTPTASLGGPAIEEPVSYTVPAPSSTGPVVPAARLTSYVVAHSEYSSPLGRRNVLSGVIAEDPTPLDEPPAPQDGNDASH